MSAILQNVMPSASSDRRPMLLEFRSSKPVIAGSVLIATFTDMFLYGVIVPVVPFALQQRVGVPAEDDQRWVSILVAIYGVFLFIGCPLFGYMSDLARSRRWPYLVGLFGLAAATGLLTAGTHLGLWIAGRALQGLAGAVVAVTGAVLLVDNVGKDEIGSYLGYLGAAQSLGLVVGPLLGGVVYDQGGYYAVFEMCFGLIGLDIVLRLICVEKVIARKWLEAEGRFGPKASSPDPEKTEGDSTKDSGSNEDVETEKADMEKREPQTTSTGAHEGPPQDEETVGPAPRKKSKIPPVITLLKSRRLLMALYGSFAQAVIYTAFDSTLPLFAQRTFGWDSLGGGLIFLPVALPSFASPIVGWLVDKYGPRWFAAGGFLFAVTPLVCLRFVDHNDIGQKVLLCALLALTGFGIASTLPSLNVEISYIIDKKDSAEPGVFGENGAYASGFGLFWMAFALGNLIGPLWGGYITNAAGWKTMTWTLALLAGTTAIPTALLTGGWLFAPNEHEQDREAAGERALEYRGFA